MINIDDLIGVKYTRNGRSISTGFDCFGLAIEVLKRFGHELPDIEQAREEDYNFTNCHDILVKKINVKQIDTPTKEGDIILINKKCGPMTHIGIYLGNGQFIHCDRNGVHIGRIQHIFGFIGRVYTWL